MSRECFLIINPVSGGYSETRLKSIKALLEVAGFSVVPMMTGSPDDAACFADKLCRERDEPF
ncbi:MAG TPA: diacylglycerol kinase family lipid kinase, partial [Geobacteraceae bacterium]|nr:diacylglycerol kinase family lipid kinase [Geobacteraceae bacterium]